MTADPDNTLLIVEDDEGLQSQLRWCFTNYNVVTASDRESTIEQLRRHEPSIITLDLGLPPNPSNASEGLETLAEIQKLSPHTKVIVVTANGERENAVRAVGLGAYDFYQKPIEADELTLVVDRAWQLHQLEKENRRLVQQDDVSPLRGVVATSPQMVDVCRMVEKIAPNDVTTLITGESGTGKELLARAMHEMNARRDKNFVAISCAAIPEALLESELFGHEKGAFTSAIKQTQGKIESANGGTLFLDEIGDLPLPLQSKLLRFLQERVIERVGGREEIPIDVRIVCATHQNLAKKIEAGEYREDLYYRISEVTVEVPPLRDREGDALVLARALFKEFSAAHNAQLRGFSECAERAIAEYPWPGNVREMENRIKSAVIMTDGKQVTAKDLKLTAAASDAPSLNLRVARERCDRQAIRQAFALTAGNASKAAKLLGVSRPTLYDLINKHQINISE